LQLNKLKIVEGNAPGKGVAISAPLLRVVVPAGPAGHAGTPIGLGGCFGACSVPVHLPVVVGALEEATALMPFLLRTPSAGRAFFPVYPTAIYSTASI
jgi:hypothetical protein